MKLVAFVVLPAALLLSFGCGEKGLSSGAQLDKATRSYIWPGATLLAGADVKALKKTSLYGRYSDRLNIPALGESSEKLGFDPRQDVDSLLLESDTQRSLMIAKGNLNADAIRQKLGGMGAAKVTYKKYTLLGDNKNALALLPGKVALAGSGEAVRAGLDAHDSGNGEPAMALTTRLQAIPSSAQIWVISSKGLPFAELPMRSDVQSALSNIVTYISGTTASAQVSDGLLARIRLDCVSPTGAQRVHDAIRGAIGLARLSTRDDQTDMLRLYDAIEVTQSGSAVELKAQLSSGEIDKLMTLLPQMRDRSPSAR